MNLEETREALKKIFEDRLSQTYAQVLKGEIEIKDGDTYAPIRRVEDVILEYLDCGGIIESGSSFDFAVKVLEESGSGIKRLNVRNLLDSRWEETKVTALGGGESLRFSEAVERNSTLTLEELRYILDNYADIEMSRIPDLGDRLEFMKQQVDLGSVLPLEPIYLKSKQYGTIEEIKANPDYTSLYIEILNKSKENLSERKRERESIIEPKGFIDPEIEAEIKSWFTPEDLQRREAELASLEAEDRTITEAEALVGKQAEKNGEQK